MLLTKQSKFFVHKFEAVLDLLPHYFTKVKVSYSTGSVPIREPKGYIPTSGFLGNG